MRKFTILLALIASALFLLPAVAMANGVSGPAFYVDGELYRTVGTPTDFSDTGAPDHSFDTIYELHGVQRNVATAAPGDPDYNGGRWMVRSVVFSDYEAALTAADSNNSGTLDSDAELHAAIAADFATVEGVIRQFECPTIPLPGNHS